MRVNNIEDLAEEVKNRSKNSEYFVIALDGRSGSGKTTLSRQLSKLLDATIIEQDDFYMGGTLDEWKKLSAQEKTNRVIDWKRIRKEALEPLLKGKEAKWHPFNWDSMEGLSPKVKTCKPSKIIILDGVYSSRPELLNLVDLTLLVKLDEEVRRERLLKREGEEVVTEWHPIWDEAEEYYFNHIRPIDTFDIIFTR